jgi:hypothetical protein
MAFERRRLFSRGKDVASLDPNMAVSMLGVTGTPREILNDESFSGEAFTDQFKYVLYMCLIQEFRNWLLTTNTVASTNVTEVLKSYDMRTHELVALCQSTLIAYRLQQKEDGKKPTKDELPPIRRQLQDAMMWFNIIIEEYPLFYNYETLETYIADHPLYCVYERRLMWTVTMATFQNRPMRLVDNYRHKSIAEKIAKGRRSVPTVKNKYYNPREYGDELFTDMHGRLKGETIMTKWSTSS